MCMRSGPSKAEVAAQERSNELQAEQALLQRQEADEAKRREAERKAEQKSEDIQDVLQSRSSNSAGQAQRRSLFASGSRGMGFLGRF